MYKVMLVDDDYPVTQLLAECIHWETLGLRLIGSHENGWSAWEHAQRETPDILITDIGMPKMDGLELTARIREMNPATRIAILSCHNEFQYAQQAMRLHVQDYLLKDTLDPEDLVQLLLRFKAAIDEEAEAGWERSRMQQLLDETKELRKEQYLKNFIQQPLLSSESWQEKATEYGLFTNQEATLPVIGYLEDYRVVKHRFASDQTLQFAISNVMKDVLETLTPRVIYVGYDVKTSFLLFAYKPGLHSNIYEAATRSLQVIQSTLIQVLKIRLSFIIGSDCINPSRLKQELNELLRADQQRFYLKQGEIVKRTIAEPARNSVDLFAYYDEAGSELKAVLLGAEQPLRLEQAIQKWINLIQREQVPLENVKDWGLRLLLDLKLKLHFLQSAFLTYSADTLHKEVGELDSLAGLQAWLIEHLNLIAQAQLHSGARQNRRHEILAACKYVSLRLHTRITLDEVAAQLHLNTSHFCRLFKKEMGMTFIEYVTRQKMQRAKELLEQTDYNVGEICEQLGYDNQSYFIKTFKTQLGMTPVEYRG